MAKTNVRGLNEFLKNLKDAVSHFDNAFFLELGEYASKRIVMMARSGKRMANGEATRLKPLSPEYIEFREKFMTGEKTGAKRTQKKAKKATKAKVVDPAFFKPDRSNLTFTGQYLESIRVTKIDRASRTLTIEPDDTPRKKGPRFIKSSGEVTNKEIAEYQAKQGRNIFGMDKQGVQVMKTKVLNEIRKQLRKKLLRK